MIERRRLKNVVIFIQTIFRFVLSKKMEYMLSLAESKCKFMKFIFTCLFCHDSGEILNSLFISLEWGLCLSKHFLPCEQSLVQNLGVSVIFCFFQKLKAFFSQYLKNTYFVELTAANGFFWFFKTDTNRTPMSSCLCTDSFIKFR